MPQAGLLELVAHGVQDVYLIGNPQITFFKTIYKRHTNFSMEAFQISYDAKPDWGNRTTFNITRYADLISGFMDWDHTGWRGSAQALRLNRWA